MAACEAGAAIVHIHVRDPESGRPSYDIGLFEETFSAMRHPREIQDNIFNLALHREPQHYGIITETPD